MLPGNIRLGDDPSSLRSSLGTLLSVSQPLWLGPRLLVRRLRQDSRSRPQDGHRQHHRRHPRTERERRRRGTNRQHKNRRQMECRIGSGATLQTIFKHQSRSNPQEFSYFEQQLERSCQGPAAKANDLTT